MDKEKNLGKVVITVDFSMHKVDRERQDMMGVATHIELKDCNGDDFGYEDSVDEAKKETVSAFASGFGTILGQAVGGYLKGAIVDGTPDFLQVRVQNMMMQTAIEFVKMFGKQIGDIRVESMDITSDDTDEDIEERIAENVMNLRDGRKAESETEEEPDPDSGVTMAGFTVMEDKED